MILALAVIAVLIAMVGGTVCRLLRKILCVLRSMAEGSGEVVTPEDLEALRQLKEKLKLIDPVQGSEGN